VIVIYDRPGQLGNQLWAYSNVFVLAKECGSAVIVVLGKEVYPFLDIQLLSNNTGIKIHAFTDNSATGKIVRRLCMFVTSDTRKRKIARPFLSLLGVRVIRNFKQENIFRKEYKRSRWYFINSWENRVNKKYFIANHSFVQSLIQPEKKIRISAAEKIASLRQKHTIIVAVHIRRGDYKNFLNGKYYFEDAVYHRYMLQLNVLFGGNNILFYIFSNEQIQTENYEGINLHFDRSQTAAGDMWSMANCDYIIGPVSTFSMWASFWKQTPLYFIENAGYTITKQNFKPIIAQDIFSGEDVMV
jgi:hypothetical protein